MWHTKVCSSNIQTCIITQSRKTSRYWNENNIKKFFANLTQKYNLNTPEDWNSITTTHITSNGGGALLSKYSIFQLKCMACPEGKSIFNNPKQAPGYWKNKENIDKFFSELKEKYNLNTPEDWNSITTPQIRSNGGASLLLNHSIFDLKCMACPEGKSIFNNPKQAPGYWENKENIDKFFSELKEKYNLNTPEDWNSITIIQIKSNGGSRLLSKYSIFQLKCMACPEGKSTFNNPKQAHGYWENKENIDKFLLELKEKYNLYTPEDWNSITQNQVISNGGRTLLKNYSMYELKCLACPEGKSIFNNPKQFPEYWENRENIDEFLSELKEKYNLNTPEDWNSITRKQILSHGGWRLLSKYSIFQLKCIACPEGKSIFNNPRQAPGYWENKENIDKFLLELKEKYNLYTPEDWNRISTRQIIALGGRGLLHNKESFLDTKIHFDNETKKSIPIKKLISLSTHKRSSQRWLFLQIQKLFPREEIVEDYFHSEISRISGANVQFDVYMIQKKIAFEYHGMHHYEDIPNGFASLETYKSRDLEKEKLCTQYGIKLIVIPYWWDNQLESLRASLYSIINPQ